jgi:predicted dehydrogenase
MDGHRISMLGTGLIGDFYTMTLHGQRSRDRVRVVYSRSDERGTAFRERWGIPESTTDLATAVEHPETDVVVVGLPNFLHEEAVGLAARAGKAVLCTKPLGRTAEEARRMLDLVESAGVFGGYLEDLCYTPKTL